jgi:hypothetical protein
MPTLIVIEGSPVRNELQNQFPEQAAKRHFSGEAKYALAVQI